MGAIKIAFALCEMKRQPAGVLNALQFFCLQNLVMTHDDALHALALLDSTQKAEVQERAVAVVGAGHLRQLAPWLLKKLSIFRGKSKSAAANRRLERLLKRLKGV